jgi:type II secretory pathway component PulC
VKKKNVTYVLVVSTLLLWGFIVYRIVSYTKSDNTVQQMEEKKVQTIRNDTFDFRLMLNYRDPFFEADRKNSNAEQVKNTDVEVTISVPEPPVFKFKGVIRNKRNMYALIESNGNIETLGRQEPIEGYRIVTLNPDSVILEKNGQKYTLKVDE